MKIYLAKNNKKEKESQPDLRLSQIAKGGEFVDIVALWKSKSGKGYSGNINLDKILHLKEEFEADKALNPTKKYDTRDGVAKETTNSMSKEDTEYIQKIRGEHNAKVDESGIDIDSIPF